MSGDTHEYGPWNPGIQSRVPLEVRHLSTIFRPENVFTSLAAATELRGLTGFAPSELVAFRPQRLALHELLIRVTADFAVPDGSRIGDLGVNFRQIVSYLHDHYVVPDMDAITALYASVRRDLCKALEAALEEVTAESSSVAIQRGRWGGAAALFTRKGRRRGASIPEQPRTQAFGGWGPPCIAECERLALASEDAQQRIVYQSLARVMSALFAAQGQAWGTRELIVTIAADLACNEYGGDCIGRAIEPLLLRASREAGYRLLPRQEHPVVVNTKGPSAAGKSTLRPLQKKLAGDLGLRWSDFALISPDIWRKQLLDYGSLGDAYKYAGAFTAEELQVVDVKLDRYMARKHRRGDMTHLLIDRFRFDSFASDSDEAGSNLLTRFGQTAYLFFMIAPPESLVERAWKRGLEFGRYKAVDDTLAHAVEAYAGIPDVFFTWVRRSDKRIQFEFLDNTVRLGERPRTVAYGDNDSFNALSVKGLLDIERYGRINVGATAPEFLYADRRLLCPEHNTGFFKRCIAAFRQVNFADQASGQIYLRIESGKPVAVDARLLETAIADPDTLAGVAAVAPAALRGEVPESDGRLFLPASGLI